MKKWYFILFFCFAGLAYGQSQETTTIEGLNIYPNPVTQGKVYITTAANDNKDIVIYDLFGNVQFTAQMRGEELNIYNVEAGIYVIRITEQNKTATRKLIVK
jgi:hypothetical protein